MTLKNNVPFRILPTTGRSAETLARRHGYKNLDSLLRSLPLDAKVLDVGAGASPLGKEVTRFRPDIHWTNLDFGYHDKRIWEEAIRGAPSNLELLAGDVTQLNELIKPSSMDVVFSYFLFPHLSTYDRQTALAAAEQIYHATKPGGLMVVGPNFLPKFHPATIRGKSWRATKRKKLTPEAYSYEVLRRTELPSYSRSVRRAFNAAVFEVFGTSRYLKGRSIISQQVYDPISKAYISIYSLTAILLVAKVLFGTAARMISHEQTSKLKLFKK